VAAARDCFLLGVITACHFGSGLVQTEVSTNLLQSVRDCSIIFGSPSDENRMLDLHTLASV
jgi:hypothetical protein